MKKEDIFYLLDLFMHQYKWEYDKTLNFIYNTPHNIINELCNVIDKRSRLDLKMEATITTVAINCALSGKMDGIDKLFSENNNKEEVNESEYKGQLMNLWIKMGKDIKDFNEAYEKGKVEF